MLIVCKDLKNQQLNGYLQVENIFNTSLFQFKWFIYKCLYLVILDIFKIFTTYLIIIIINLNS